MKMKAVRVLLMVTMLTGAQETDESRDKETTAILVQAFNRGWELPVFKLPGLTKLEKTEVRCGNYLVRDSKQFDGISKGPSMVLRFAINNSARQEEIKDFRFRTTQFVPEVVQGWNEGFRARCIWNSNHTLIEKVVVRMSEADYQEIKLCLD